MITFFSYIYLKNICHLPLPNHFHLVIKILKIDAASKLMRRILTTYSVYFNRKVGREGPLFQGRYRGVAVSSDEQLVHLSRYAHCNSLDIKRDPFTYEYSSLPYYLGERRADWVKTDLILEMVGGPKDYRQFIKNYQKAKEEELNLIDDILFLYIKLWVI